MNRSSILVMVICSIFTACSKNLCNEMHLYERFESKNEALINENIELLTNIAHPQLSFVHSNGWKEDIHSFLKNSQAKGLKYKDISIDSLKTIVVGKTGIVTGLGLFDINFKNNDLKIPLYFTETYVCVDKDWKLLSRHSCRKP